MVRDKKEEPVPHLRCQTFTACLQDLQAEAVRFYVIIFVTIGGELSVEGCVMWRGCVVVRRKAFVLGVSQAAAV